MQSLHLSVVISPAAVPAAEWEARILQAKRCGMNAIEASDAPAAFAALCAAHGMAVVPPGEPVAISADIGSDALRAFAGGATAYRFGDAPFTSARFAVRRVAHFARTWAHILLNGERKTGLKASRGLTVSETVTAQNGAITFVGNDTADLVEGYVPPFLPDISLRPGEYVAYVHDAPVGEPVAGGKFLASYVGLVKSDAAVLAAHIRPLPHEGARIYVYGKPGDSAEVVLFHGSERGTGVSVRFADVPQVYDAAPPSQIVALSMHHAGRTFFPLNENAPVIIGADDVTAHGDDYATVEVAPGRPHTLFALSPAGALTEISVVAPMSPFVSPDFDDATWQAVTLPDESARAGWYRGTIELPDAGDVTVLLGGGGGAAVYLNGTQAAPGYRREWDAATVAGRNTVVVNADAPLQSVSLNPSGACYVVEVSQWRYSSASGAAILRIAL